MFGNSVRSCCGERIRGGYPGEGILSLEVGLVIFAVGLVTLVLTIYEQIILPKKSNARVLHSLKVFSTAVELRFPLSAGLSDRVYKLTKALAEELDLPQNGKYRLEKASRLRNIGLCAVPWKLINNLNPTGWSDAEVQTYIKHCQIGGAMLELVPSLSDLAQIVRCKHAAFDGTDGPLFPQGEDLPVESRLLAVVVDFVLIERLQGTDMARSLLRNNSGTRYDPRAAEAFLRVLPIAAAAHDDSERSAMV